MITKKKNILSFKSIKNNNSGMRDWWCKVKDLWWLELCVYFWQASVFGLEQKYQNRDIMLMVWQLRLLFLCLICEDTVVWRIFAPFLISLFCFVYFSSILHFLVHLSKPSKHKIQFFVSVIEGKKFPDTSLCEKCISESNNNQFNMRAQLD